MIGKNHGAMEMDLITTDVSFITTDVSSRLIVPAEAQHADMRSRPRFRGKNRSAARRFQIYSRSVR
jgi:hypothetical protein